MPGHSVRVLLLPLRPGRGEAIDGGLLSAVLHVLPGCLHRASLHSLLLRLHHLLLLLLLLLTGTHLF
jgi:hypothetical protein